jgi:hypothetical protein
MKTLRSIMRLALNDGDVIVVCDSRLLNGFYLLPRHKFLSNEMLVRQNNYAPYAFCLRRSSRHMA